jgi:hypothetical protein
MGEDPLDHARVVDRGDQLHPPGAEEVTSQVGPRENGRVLHQAGLDLGPRSRPSGPTDRQAN